MSVIFGYTTVVNMVERPDGLKIASCFVSTILHTSKVSRLVRSTELRASTVTFDDQVLETVMSISHIRLIPAPPTMSAYRVEQHIRRLSRAHRLSGEEIVLIEVVVDDPSDFESDLNVVGGERYGYPLLTAHSSSIANTLAAVALEIQHITGHRVHLYFRWTEGKPVHNLVRFLLFGEGGIGTTTHEIVREVEPNPACQPWIHVT